MPDSPPPNRAPRAPTAFFERTDWAAFLLTTVVALIVYVVTLSPELDLEYSGNFITGAMYPGPSEPPGQPLYAITGWLFIQLCPWGNIARRLALASALAAALTCGIIALLVSRVGWLAVQTIKPDKAWSQPEMFWRRVICGAVAGMAFALDGCVWRQAVVPETWSLDWLLLAIIMCLLTRWIFNPSQRRWLAVAALMCGLGLSESQALISVIFGVPFLIAAGDRALGRDWFLLGAFLAGALCILDHFSYGFACMLERIVISESSSLVVVMALAMYALPGIWLAIRTRRIFREWKSIVGCGALFFIGLGAYFLLPLYSLTDPPMNWGYARTVAGFFHLTGRGQYETPELTMTGVPLQLEIYFHSVWTDLGVIYLLAALSPFLFLHRITGRVRGWLVSVLILNLILIGLNAMVLNLSFLNYRDANPYFASSHLILILFSGCGLMLLAAWFTGAEEKTESDEKPDLQTAFHPFQKS